MPGCHSPFIICRLTDQYGRLVSPFTPNAITFTPLCPGKQCFEGETKNKAAKNRIPVLIKGYVVVCVEGKEPSPPIPFCIREHICISAPKGTFPDFSVMRFRSACIPVTAGEEGEIVQVNVLLEIGAAVRSCAYVDVMVRPVAPSPDVPEQVCINVKRVFDRVCLTCGTRVAYEMLLGASVCQYSALSDGAKKIYTNDDELREYGEIGILAPDAVYYHALFINGMLQPEVNYIMTQGHLELLTGDLPPQGAPVLITFVTFGRNHDRAVHVENDMYVAVSTGTKRVFTDGDELTEYGEKGIPAPDGVSYFNLYVNGALQPKTNYTVREGILELTTDDLPPPGAMLVLESLAVKDEIGRLLRADVYAYNARSDGKKIYTDRDEIAMYGNEGIWDPQMSSYQNLFMNGVLQPQINYSVREGLLTLHTQDAPQKGAPVTLQFVRIFAS